MYYAKVWQHIVFGIRKQLYKYACVFCSIPDCAEVFKVKPEYNDECQQVWELRKEAEEEMKLAIREHFFFH